MPRSPNAEFNVRVVTSLLVCAVGIWFAFAGRAHFLLGGDEYGRRALNVDVTGWGTVAIACAFVAVGIINLAVGVRGPMRLPVFWTGVALLGTTILYGVVQLFI